MKLSKFSILIILTSMLLAPVLVFPPLVKAQEVLLNENFDDNNANDGEPVDWEEFPGHGSWNVEDGKYIGTSSSGTQGPLTLVGETTWNNYSLNVQVKDLVGVDRHILFRYDNTRTIAGYVVKYRDANQGLSGFIELQKVNLGELGVSGTVLSRNESFNPHTGETHDIRIEAVGNRIKVFADNSLKIDYVDINNPILNGKVGFFVQRSGIGITNSTGYDNVSVKSLVPINYAFNMIFSDDFNDNNITDWEVKSNNCTYLGQPADWGTNNGQLGFITNGGACSTFLMPENVSINPGINYSVSADMRFASSLNMDRNFIVKFQDLANWYGLHFIGNTVYLDKVVNGTEHILPNRQFTYPFVVNQTYNIRVNVINSSFEIYINDQLVHVVTDESPSFPQALAGVAASAGGVPSSEVWFDNFTIEEITINADDEVIQLTVPNLKQSDSPWGGMIYNNYPNTAVNETIRKWGCYLTSASMIMQFYQYNLNPDQLNEILKQNNGYTKGHGVDLSKVAAYTKILNPTDHLEYKWYNFSTEVLDAELEAGRAPIVKLQGNALPFSTHFIVVTGKVGSDYLINDPEPTSTKTKLSEYSSELYNHIRTLVPSQTDFSYINVYTSYNVTPHLFDSQGNEITEYSYVEGPIKSDDGSEELTGEPVNVISYPKPSFGNYTITFSGDGPYQAEINLIDTDGEVVQETIEAQSAPTDKSILLTINEDNEIIVPTPSPTPSPSPSPTSIPSPSPTATPIITPSPTPTSTPQSEVTIDSVLQYFEHAYKQKQVKNKTVYQIIRTELLLAEYLQSRNRIVLYKASLILSMHHIQKATPKYITTQVSQKLIRDLTFLLKN